MNAAYIDSLYRKPSPDVLFELAKTGKNLARYQGKNRWRQSRYDRHARFFLPKLVSENAALEEGEFRYATHRFTGRVAYLGHQHWSMRIAEAFWVRGEDGPKQKPGENQDGYRTTYKFEWTKDRTLIATKHVNAKHVPLPGETEPARAPVMAARNEAAATDLQAQLRREYALEVVGKMIVDPVLREVVAETERVSQADCVFLINSIRAAA